MARPQSIELGPYQLHERIGEGGSGQVYRATGPGGVVAVKVLGPSAELDDAAVARFSRELTALQQIAHPNLVKLLDHGVDAELGPYLVLPLLPGTNLRTIKTICPEAAILLALPIVDATAALHAAGYVHRDLKPENAIAGPDGTVTVIDLGLAWRDGMTRHTDTGAAVGSVGYMAPEQIEGGTVGDRADVWALGVMIYEWIAGKRPFQRPRPAEEAAAMLLGACPRLDAADRRCDARLADVIARCLAVDPGKRPSAAELAKSLGDQIDWTDTPETERATVVADPAAYQTRVAAFRVRRVERLANDALAGGKPFVALAQCDRGLAYVPDHPALLELVAQAEAATAKNISAEAVAPTVAVALPPKKSSKWPVIAALGLVGGVALTYLLVPANHTTVITSDPWNSPRPPPTKAELERDEKNRLEHEKDMQTFNGAVSLFGSTIDRFGPKLPPPKSGGDYLTLAKTQTPADSIPTLRQALIADPTSLEAQAMLCTALAAADQLAETECSVALASKIDPALLMARARSRRNAGDHKGAKADLDRACGLGDSIACKLDP